MIVNCEKEKILLTFHHNFLFNYTKVPAPLQEIHGYFYHRSFTYIVISIFLILIHRNHLTFYDHLSK